MTAAWAAEAAAHHASEAFYLTSEFWVTVAFIILVSVAGRTVWHTIVTGLDHHAAAIRKRVEEADALLDDAKNLLATYHRRQRDAADETAAIVERARVDAQRITEKATADLERSVERREQLARERVAQAEHAAVAEVRAVAVDVAMEATRRLLAEKLSDAKAASLIDDAIGELPDKLN